MSRLPRPRIPQDIQLAVVLKQLSGDCAPAAIRIHIDAMRRARRLGVRLAQAKESLARQFGCNISDLRLDHTWALENREKIFNKAGEHVEYKPAANDPEWLSYRPHGTQFTGSHDVKTRIRGDRGAHSDLALNNKLKNIARNRDPGRKKKKIQQRKRPWPKGRKIPSRRKQ